MSATVIIARTMSRPDGDDGDRGEGGAAPIPPDSLPRLVLPAPEDHAVDPEVDDLQPLVHALTGLLPMPAPACA